MPTYRELLLDPRWQRKRLQILQRSDFSCEDCGESTKTLHVHHKVYRKGAMPWGYEDHELQSLCVDCHERITEIRKKLDAALALLATDEIERVVGYALMQAMFRRGGSEARIEVWEPRFGDFGLVTGMADWIYGDIPGDMVDMISAAESGVLRRLELLDLRITRLQALGIAPKDGEF